jgi:WD40 repeat protein
MATWSQDPSERLGRFRRSEGPPEPDAPPPKPRFPHDLPIRAAGLSCDRRFLVAIDARGFVNGWDAVTAKRLYRLPLLDPKEGPQRLTFSPDGRFVAVSPWSFPAGLVRVLDPRTGKELRRFDRGFSPSFSPDSELLACSDGTQLRRWALKNGAELPRFPECEFPLKWTAWSSAQDRIAASGEESRAVAIWDAATGQRMFQGSIDAEGEAAGGLAFSPDGDTLAVGSHWGIRFFAVGKGPKRDFQVHEEYSQSPIKFSRDGRRMLALSHRRRLLVWGTLTGRPLFTWASFETEDGNLEISEGGDVAIWIERGGIRLERLPRILAGPQDGHVVRHLSFTADGQLLTGDDGGGIRVWDPAAEKELRRMTVPLDRLRYFARNGTWAVFGGADGPVGIWDLQAEREILKLEPATPVVSVSITGDGSRLALGHSDGTLSIWSVAEKRELARVQSEMRSITAVAWSSDGKSLGWGDEAGAVTIGEGQKGGEQIRFKTRGYTAIRDVRFTPDGRTLMATDSRGNEWAYSDPGVEPTPNLGDIRSLPPRWLPDPRWIASGFGQKRALLGIRREVISPDGTYVAGATRQGELVIWEAPGAK